MPENTVIGRDAVTVPPQPPVMVYVILQLPAPVAVTSPEALTVATALLLLLQVPLPPPKIAELVVKVVEVEIQRLLIPVTEAILAFGFIVIDC